MTDTSKEAVEAVAAAQWALASTDISATLRALSAERDGWQGIYTECFADAASNSIRLAEGEHRAKTAEARVKVLEAAMGRIWDHCQNSGIEHATVGMRVIERVEDEVAAVRKDRSHE